MSDTLILESLLKKEENSRLAFVGEADVESVCKVATSLVNSDGGDILIGVNSKKKVYGIINFERIIHDVTIGLRSDIKPSMPFSITPFQLKGKQVILLSVWSGANKPYNYKGKIYVRSGNLSVPASGHLMDQLINESEKAFFN